MDMMMIPNQFSINCL